MSQRQPVKLADQLSGPVRIGVAGAQFIADNASLVGPQDCQCPVGGQLANVLAEVEVIGKFSPFLLLVFDDFAAQFAAVPQPLTQLALQVGVFGDLFGEDLPGSFQCVFCWC